MGPPEMELTVPRLLNFVVGAMTCRPATTWVPGNRAMPAGLENIVEASSAAAAPPANALPRPLGLISNSWKPDANAMPEPVASRPPRPAARVNWYRFIL